MSIRKVSDDNTQTLTHCNCITGIEFFNVLTREVYKFIPFLVSILINWNRSKIKKSKGSLIIGNILLFFLSCTKGSKVK